MRKGFIYIFVTLLLLVSFGCASRKKNTSQTRMYHSFVAYYNTGFNGKEAYKKGYQEQVKGNKDNYLDFLPWLMVGNEDTRKAGTGSYTTAIEKAQKTIKQHSIKKKPIKKAGRMTEKQKKFFAKKEFNPYLHNAWFLMGKSYFQQGEFLEAASTFSYMLRLYSDNPKIISEARIRMAQCYTELEWFYEAEDLLIKAKRDTMPYYLEKDFAGAYANFYLKQKRYQEALPYLEKAVKRSGRVSGEKAREYYLLGQVYKETGNNEAAFKAFQKVIRTHPPYELEFSARIRQTETVSGKDSKKMIKKLESMAKNVKNENYLDQLYYAIGNIYMAMNDTVKALEEYETGLENSKSTYGKKAILLCLSELYWERGEYSKAQPCYSQLVGLLTKEDTKYAEVNLRSKVLENLVVHTDNITLQDSLQHLATLPEEELYVIIDSIIEDVIQKEEEEKKAAEDAELMAQREEVLADANIGMGGSNSSVVQSNDNSWYFYNPQVVEQGKTSFQQKWGKRKLEDHWRRRNKTVLANDDFEEVDYAATDSLAQDSTVLAEGEIADSTVVDSLSNDPHERAYYLQQIPFTEEQMAESNAILSDALFNAGLIYKDELEDKDLAEGALMRVVNSFPDFEKMEEIYYNLFLMYSRWGFTEQAEECKQWLKDNYPEGKYTLTICDPNFERNALYGKHLEDSLYTETYALYKEGSFEQVKENNSYSAENYPMGRHRPKFMFLNAMSLLQTGEKDNFLELLKEIVTNYPKDEISELAGLIAQGLQDGRLLASGTFGSIWDRRKGGGFSSDSLPDSIASFSPERYTPFYFILAYPQDSVSENQLLFEVARYNFTNYMVRNFNLEFVNESGIGMLQIKEFINFDEAYLYMKRLYSDGEMARKLSGLRAVIISPENLALLNQYYSFADYEQFYNENFLNIPEPEIKGYTLDEPTFEEGVEYEEELHNEE